MLFGITIEPYMLIGGGIAIFTLVVFQILQGSRKIKFKGKLHLQQVQLLVLDEFDRLLDDQNQQGVADIVRLLPQQRQVLLEQEPGRQPEPEHRWLAQARPELPEQQRPQRLPESRSHPPG